MPLLTRRGGLFFMGIRSAFYVLRLWANLSVLILLLCGCVAGVAADIVSIGTSGKSVVDHLLDVVTEEDCNIFRGVTRPDRAVCEPRVAAVTAPAVTAPAVTAPAFEVFPDPVDALDGPRGDPGGPSGSEPY